MLKIKAFFSILLTTVSILAGLALPGEVEAVIPLNPPLPAYGCYSASFDICPATPMVGVLTCIPAFIENVPLVYEATYIWGSELFMWWNMGMPTIWTTGGYLPPIPCLDFAPNSGFIDFMHPIIHLLPFSGSSFPTIPISPPITDLIAMR